MTMPTDSDRLIALREFVEKRFAAMKQTCPSTPEDEHALGCTLILAEIDRLLAEPATEGKTEGLVEPFEKWPQWKRDAFLKSNDRYRFKG